MKQRISAAAMIAAVFLLIITKLLFNPGEYEVLLWLPLAAAAFFLSRRKGANVKKKNTERALIYTLLSTGVYLALWWISGYGEGFGHSPYARSPLGILRNLCMYGGLIILQEAVRWFSIGYASASRRMVALEIIALTLYNIRPVDVTRVFANASNIFSFAGGALAPALVGTFFYTWLARAAGPVCPILYRFIPQCVMWVLPALPKASWQTQMMLGAAVPLFAMLIMQQEIGAGTRIHTGRRKRRKKKKAGLVGWISLISALATAFAFFFGLLPVRPMVIATGSMLPVIRPGDMVIVKDVEENELQVGDIAAYQSSGYQIVHRIQSIYETGGSTYYIFKGDNNSDADGSAVSGSQIAGKVIQVVPYAGMLSLSVRTFSTQQSLPVETGNSSK